jgi:hypothetical protein
VIKSLTKAKLKFSIEKSRFAYRVIQYLGYFTDGETITMDPKKISTFVSLSKPENVVQLRSFLGLANYLREFIPNYSMIAAPLESIKWTKEPLNIVWNDKCTEAFELLKKVLSSHPVLSQPDFSVPFCVATDASDTGIGAVLFQDTPKGRKYINFASSALTTGQKGYPVLKKELLAVIFAVQKFHD